MDIYRASHDFIFNILLNVLKTDYNAFMKLKKIIVLQKSHM